MKKVLTFLIILFASSNILIAQDSIKYSLVLIGDAGEINPVQHAVIDEAVKQSTPGKSLVLFLGDNIYRRGMGLNADDATKKTEEILRSQYQPFRNAGIPVYFIPGNHDWDHSGVKGVEKINKVNNFIREQQDSLLQIIPKDACAGPVEINVSDDILIVAIDSEWWLYPFDIPAENSDCEYKTKADVLGKLEEIVERNSNKLIFFASHHPFKTYGSHGGYYSLKEHVFPLTGLGKGLYIPLPVIGSLYPLLRSTFPPAQDVKNYLYREMKEGIENILKKHPNVIHVAGHEHTLQLIQGQLLQVVSGSGAKKTPVKNGRGTLFAQSESGYVKADVMKDNTIRLSFYSYQKEGFQNSFIYNKAFTIPQNITTETAEASLGDSITLPLPGNYNKPGKFHRSLFGENYRKIWATEVTFRVLKISEAGLTPTELGGGMQTRSLRLQDKLKKEWVIRSVDKYPDLLLPRSLANTFAASILKDNVTAAFPYAPLVVPVFADALGVPHSNPTIVYLSPDKNLGIYSRNFAKTIHLFEEREPVGKSITTQKMMENLKEDNDNSIDQKAFLTARLLDIFIGDWDRHGDQWRWMNVAKNKNKLYQPIPRDRDQVFYINQGLFPAIFSLPWLQPKFQGFGNRIRNINTFSFNARFIDGLFTNQLSLEEWVNITGDVTSKLSDTLIETALKKLPAPVYQQIHTILAAQLKNRKTDLVKKSPQYFRFLNKIIDLTLSDKNELVKITSTADKKLNVSVYKLTGNGEPGNLVFSRLLDPALTKELRLYLFGGTDNVVVENQHTAIKLRIIGDATSAKKYELKGNGRYLRKIHIYEGLTNGSYTGESDKAHLHLSDKKENTDFQVTARYNKTIPLLNIGYNVDDGLILGGGVRFIRQGFRKNPYASSHQLSLSHAFYTNGFKFRYGSEWLKAAGNADILLSANIFAPDNTQNFFGRGNETVFNRTGNFRRYYRSVFTIVQAEPAFRWRKNNKGSIIIGPSIQYYHFEASDNKGRFINNVSLINSYDSATIINDKAHAGVVLNLIHDSRNSLIFPTSGSFLNLKIKGYSGLNDYSKSFAQVSSEIALFKPLGRKANFIIANRLGGGVTFGKTTFYQSFFLGGQENLLGYRQYRFAGLHTVYNNLEARIKLANIASYIVPGQLGLVGFYDVGRVWEKNEKSTKWHQGVGGGIYFAPAQLLLLQLVAGKSVEGWYPYFTMGCRF